MKKRGTVLSILYLVIILSLLSVTSISFPKEPVKEYDLEKDKVLYVTAVSHLDTQWRWTIQETINKFIPNTLHENFSLFEKFPSPVYADR